MRQTIGRDHLLVQKLLRGHKSRFDLLVLFSTGMDWQRIHLDKLCPITQ